MGGEYDAVIHLAAKAGVVSSILYPLDYIQLNIRATTALLEWLQAQKITKYIFASSSSVYGNNTKVPFSEKDGTIHSISSYAFSKRSCELLNYTYHFYGIDVINLRFFTVYGERQRPDLAVRKFADSIWSGEPITIFGSGNTARDYTCISDTISGVSLAIEYLFQHEVVFEIINLGSTNPVYIKDLIDTIANELAIKPLVRYAPMRPGDVNITFADNFKANQILGYQPYVNLKAGIARFIKWFLHTKK